MPLAEWIVSQPPVARFVQRAHAATPHRWNIGEDTVLGMCQYLLTYLLTCLPAHSLDSGARYVGAHVALRDHGAALGMGQDTRPVLHL